MLYRLFIPASAFLSVLFCTQVACDSNPGETSGNQTASVSGLIEKAGELSASYPDSSMIFADSAIAMSVRLALPDSIHLRAVHARAEVLSSSGMPDSAFLVIQQFYLGMDDWPDSSVLTMTLFYLSWYGYQGGHVSTAYRYISEAVNLVERVGPWQNRCGLMTFYSDILVEMGRFVEAQSWLFKSIRLAESSKDSFSLAMAYLGIGRVFGYMENNVKSREYYQKAVDLFIKTSDNEHLCAVLSDIGLTYRLSDPDSALYYYNQVLNPESEGIGKRVMVITLFNKANIYSDGRLNVPGQLDIAMKLYGEVLQICEHNGIKAGIPRVYSGFASVAYKNGNYSGAEAYLRKGIELCEQNGDKNTMAALMREYRPIYENRKDWAKLIQLNTRLKSVEDSISDAHKIMDVSDIEWKYQMERKELEYQTLKNELALETHISRLRMILILLFTVVLLVTIVLAHRNKRLNERLRTAYSKLMDQYQEERKQRQSMPYTDTGSYKGIVDLRLRHYLDNEKPYLNPDLRASDVMNSLLITRQELYEALKKQGFSNFNAFINYLRVQEMQSRFENPSFDLYTIDAIAKDAGFRSRSTFYSVFEATTGVKPAYYRSRIRAFNG